jgi:hypothetical protein
MTREGQQLLLPPLAWFLVAPIDLPSRRIASGEGLARGLLYCVDFRWCRTWLWWPDGLCFFVLARIGRGFHTHHSFQLMISLGNGEEPIFPESIIAPNRVLHMMFGDRLTRKIAFTSAESSSGDTYATETITNSVCSGCILASTGFSVYAFLSLKD